MRIKSYFAPSVQTAITLARQEFGDTVTLVTSHVAAPENRALGEYEVVFAVEGEIAVTAAVETPEPPPSSAAVRQERTQTAPTPPFHEFQTLLLQAVAAPASTTEQLPQKLAHLRGCLIELGLPAAGVLQVMSLVEQLAGIGDHVEEHSQVQPVHSQQASEPVLTSSSSSSPTSAELLFSQSVANPGTGR